MSSLDVTREYVNDGKRVNMEGVIGDETYDSRRNFKLLDEKGIEPMIRVRRNAVEGSGCRARRRALTMQRDSLELWRRKYGLRWIAESAFSWMKRVFGGYVTAKKLKNMIKEITLKVFIYNLFIGMRETA